MDALPDDVEFCRCGIEVLVFETAEFIAVEGVCVRCAELRHVEPIDTLSNFLIRCKCNLDGSMLHLRMCQQVLDSSHDLCNASLVVGSQKSRAICHNEVLALVQQTAREVGWAQNHVLLCIQNNVLTVVSRDDAWLHPHSRCVRI